MDIIFINVSFKHIWYDTVFSQWTLHSSKDEANKSQGLCVGADEPKNHTVSWCKLLLTCTGFFSKTFSDTVQIIKQGEQKQQPLSQDSEEQTSMEKDWCIEKPSPVENMKQISFFNNILN